MKRLFFRVFALALAGVVALLGLFVWFAYTPVGLRQSPLDFTVEPGSGMRQVARQLTDAGIDTWPFALVMLARVTRQANGIKAGSYGSCEACGDPILKERLKLMPHARNCIECQRKEEEGLL